MAKKFSFLLLAFLLLGPVMLFACAKDDPPPIDFETTDSESVADSNTNADTSSNRKTDLSLYKIVTEANSSGKEIASARSLQSALREVGLDLSMEEDNQSVPTQEAKEILIGSTNRSETAQIFEKLPKDRGYAISFLENKIVLVARSSSFLEAASVFKKPTEQQTRLTKNSFAVMTLDYSKYTCSEGCDPKYDNNGLSYIITLSDGRFIIYDGGYAYPRANDDEIIYEFLRDRNIREGKPVIAAWILTHSHNDHYGAFTTFSERFAHLVEVENIVANTAPAYCYSKGHDATLEDMTLFTKRFGSNTKQIRPHIGQVLYFGEVEIEVLYTHDQFHFNRLELNQENSASMVTRIRMDGITYFIPGDAKEAVSMDLVRLYGNDLKSDFMQINHHGNRGGKIELYEAVNPSYALWNTSKYGFEKRTAGIPYPIGMPHEYDAKLNHRIYTDLGADHCWCADDEVDILSFDENKALSIELYKIRPDLLPERIPYQSE